MNKKSQKIKLIYLVGGGHSGSTILSFLLGTSQEVLNVGELKFYSEHRNPNEALNYMKNVCSCGTNAVECPFWREIDKEMDSNAKIFHYPTFFEWINILRIILWPLPTQQKTLPKWDDIYLIQNIYSKIEHENKKETYILDTSKSLARLVHLSRSDELDIKIIFLVRDIRGHVDSYQRAYGKGFFRWIIQWIINNSLILYFLKKEHLDYYHLSYDLFCKKPGETLAELGNYLDIRIPENYKDTIRNTEFHVRAGNPIKNTIKNFSGIRIDERWKNNLSNSQKWIIKKTVSKLNKLWVYDGE